MPLNRYGLMCALLMMFNTFIVSSKAQVVIPTPEQFGSTMQPVVKQQYDEDAFTWYAAYTDDKNIYVRLALKDSLQKRKLLQNGMELWIDSKGKKNKITGIMFPLGEKANMYPGGGNRNAAGGPPPFFTTNTNDNTNADSVLAVMAGKQQEAELKGFAGNINGRQPLGKLTGFTITTGMQHDTLLYTAVIPLAAFMQQPLKGAISIGIFEKGIELPGFNGGDGPGGDMDGGGGLPPGDGMGGPPGEGPGGDIDMRRLFQTNVIWYKLKPHN